MVWYLVKHRTSLALPLPYQNTTYPVICNYTENVKISLKISSDLQRNDMKTDYAVQLH